VAEAVREEAATVVNNKMVIPDFRDNCYIFGKLIMKKNSI